MDDECITISQNSFGQTCQQPSPTRTLEICHTVGMLDCKDSHQDGLNIFNQTSWFASLWKGSLLLRFHGALLKCHVEKSVVEVNWMSICASTNQPSETSRSSADGQAKVLNCPPPLGIRRRTTTIQGKMPNINDFIQSLSFFESHDLYLKNRNSRYSIPYPSLVSVTSSRHHCPLPPDSPSQPDQSFIYPGRRSTGWEHKKKLRFSVVRLYHLRISTPELLHPLQVSSNFNPGLE